ncbi:phenylacetate--CoA ligase family protein [Pseudomonas moraviensis subsp. stanleyae]|uniref:phenylacetate--CoA ligase family protein n=1 Tax=Pseudomonas moraviensis TaxID=321662 RepID=UPI002E3034F2|nr:phenylacetate--CoA ligase family protein [Pseudomonas moraviensis]MED7666350.1 phenylacetate--CoA ligase family protein [Pseudomonas moraviensis subsp. stanleyae]
MKKTDPISELTAFAREHSPYYKNGLADVPEAINSLSELPLLDPAALWKGSANPAQWPVLTAPIAHALVFKTGGSTGGGRLSVYTRAEWQRTVEDFGHSLNAQLSDGDRVANLFFAGDLYASFLFIHASLAHVETAITEFPFSGEVAPPILVDAIAQYRINVLAGVPAQLLTFASWLQQRGLALPLVDTVLYGGESLFASQRQLLEQVLPNARFASIGYASVDGGFIGASHRDCIEGEHRTPDGHVLLEIVDQHTGATIEACDQPGLLVLTNLHRRLMPLIRYPVGDLACWREPAGTAQRKFALRGRSGNSQRVRVGILSLMTDEISESVRSITGSNDWQLLIEQADGRDVLTLKYVVDERSTRIDEELEARLIELYPQIPQLVGAQLLQLHVQSCRFEDLARHPRAGKSLRIVDLRCYDQHDGEVRDESVDPAQLP